jgi:hypothetical protein
MRRFLRYRPSPVTVIVALVSSLVFAGIAYANLPGRNSVISSDIAPRAVHNSDDATGSVNSRVIRNGSILLGDLNSTTIAALKGAAGAPGAPGTPGAPGAPGATGSPGATVSGGGVTKFFFTTDNGADTGIFSVGGFHLSEECGTTDMLVHFTSGADNSMLSLGSFTFNDFIHDTNFDNNNVDTIGPGDNFGTFQYVERGGTVVAANYWAEDGGDNFGSNQNCSLHGMAEIG